MSYKDFYGMRNTPFQRNIPPESMLISCQVDEGLSRLHYAVDEQKFAVLTGPSGVGKSSLLRKLKSILPREKYSVFYASDSKLTPRWLYSNFLKEAGHEPEFYRTEGKRRFQSAVITQAENLGKKVVCIVDEAHLLDRETMEEFRFFLNVNFDSETPTALILSGQSELLDKLSMNSFEAIRQRIDIYVRLHGLDRQEANLYIRSHLKYAGANENLFDESAVDAIEEASGGILRKINHICENCLLYGVQHQKQIIDADMVQYVVEHEIFF